MYLPDDLLTLGVTTKQDVDPHLIAPDPFELGYQIDDLLPRLSCDPDVQKKEEPKMTSTNHDEKAIGVNGRLRPRKSSIAITPPSRTTRKSERTIESKHKKDNVPNVKQFGESEEKSEQTFLCLYCEKKFYIKASLSQHLRRVHFSTSGQDLSFDCNFCIHKESGNLADNAIVRHMVDCHSNQYFTCLSCKTRFISTSELASHQITSCDKKKPYRSKLRTKNSGLSKRDQKLSDESDTNIVSSGTGLNSIVISCELKPSQGKDAIDIEENITTNLILPPCKNLTDNSVLEKNAIILLDDIQWNKSIGTHFSFRNTDTEQILSRLGVVHRSPRTSESTRRDWYKNVDETTKFEKCFDTSFYSRVAGNIQENLSKFLDGSFNRFSPDFDNVIKTRKANHKVVINTAEGFPILLAPEQYSRNPIDSYMPRAIAPKHKWKWDNLEIDNTKNVYNQDNTINRDSHANSCIVSLVSSLDIWTQLCMRRKYEAKFNNYNNDNKKIDKQTVISNELKEIIESREIPSTSTHVVKYTSRPKVQPCQADLEFPASLGLVPSASVCDVPSASLSGEWVRPRCYVCCACGEQTQDSKALSAHIANQHPNAQIAHYEIVGESLLNADIMKHLYVPPSQDLKRTRPLRGSRECTKCKKSVSFDELHQHMLECAGDTPVVRRRCRYRPFGVRRRRPRLPDNRIRKRIRKDIRNQQNRQKGHLKPRNRIRTEVGDAETIRKMLADLPAKRHRVAINPINPVIRTRKSHDKQRQLLLNRRVSENPKNKRPIRKLNANVNPEKVVKNHVISDTAQPRKNCMTQKVSATKKEAILKRSVKNIHSQQSHSNQSTLIISSTNNNLKQIESHSVSNEIIMDSLSLNSQSEKININNGANNPRESSNRDTSNRENRDGRHSRNNDPGKNNFSQNNAPSQNAPLKHSIARLTSKDDPGQKYIKYHSHFFPQHNYLTSFHNVQYMPTGQPLFFENEIVVSKLDKPPLLDTSKKMDIYRHQKNKLNKPKKGLNDCIAMLKNKLVDTSPQHNIIPSPVNEQRDTKRTETIMMEVNNHVEDYANMSLLSTPAIPPAHTNVTSLITVPLDLSGKSEKLVSTYDTSLDLSIKSTNSSNASYVTLDLSNKSLSQNEDAVKKSIDNKSETNSNHILSDASLDLCIKSPAKSIKDSSLNNTDILDLTGNSTKDMYVTPNSAKTKHLMVTNDIVVTKDLSTANCIQKEVTLTHSSVAKPVIEVSPKKAVENKKISEKSIPKSHPNKSIEKVINQKPIYDPTLKIPQYKIRANNSENTKETEKIDQKQTGSLETGGCNIEILPKEIVDILGTMPVQHRNKLLNVLPQVFAKTVKQLKLAVDSNVGKEIITSANKTEIATQTSNALPEQTCPPEFVDVDTDKFLIDPVTGVITERIQSENEPSESLQSEKIIDLIIEENKVEQESLTPKFNTDVTSLGTQCDPTVNMLLTLASPVKHKSPNDQTASLRAVRIKSANEKLKSVKNECLDIAPNQGEKIQPRETDKITSEITESADNQDESNTKTTLAIQQSEVTSTQQNSCVYKQLSPPVPDLQKNSCSVSGPISESRVGPDITNSDEDIELPSNNGSNINSDLTSNSKSISQNIENTTNNRNNKNNNSTINCHVNRNVDEQPNQNTSQIDLVTKTKSKSRNVAEDKSDVPIDIEPLLKNTTPKLQTTSISKFNNVIDCRKLEDDDSEDDISLATILKQKKSLQSAQICIESANISLDRSVTTKTRKRKIKRNTSILSTLEKNRSNANVAVKKNKTQNLPKQSIASIVDGGPDCISKPNKEMDSSLKEENLKVDASTTYALLQTPSSEHSEIANNNFIDKDTADKKTRDHQRIRTKKQIKKPLSLVNNMAEKSDYNDIENEKIEDLTETEFQDNKIMISPSHIHIQEVASSYCKGINNIHTFSNKENTKTIQSNPENFISENSKCLPLNSENDKLFSSIQLNTMNSVSSTDSKNELQDGIPSYKINENKTMIPHPIKEIIDPRNDVCKSVNLIEPKIDKETISIINKSAIDINNVAKSIVLPKSIETLENDKNALCFDGVCTTLEVEDISSIPLRRSKRGKSSYVENQMSNLEDLPTIDNCSQNKTPLTKKQLIFSKLLLDNENHSKPLNNVSCSAKGANETLNESTKLNSETETIQYTQKSAKRKNSPVVKKLKKKKTSEETKISNNNQIDSENIPSSTDCMSAEYNHNSKLDTMILNIEGNNKPIPSTKNHDQAFENELNVKFNEQGSKYDNTAKLQDISIEHENFDQDNKSKPDIKTQSENICFSNKKGVEVDEGLASNTEDETINKLHSVQNEYLESQLQVQNHNHSQIIVPCLNIDQPLSENNNKLLKLEKRKNRNSISDKMEAIYKSKKIKLNRTDKLVSNMSMTFQPVSDKNSFNEDQLVVLNETSVVNNIQTTENQPLLISCKTRSKSTTVNNLSNMENEHLNTDMSVSKPESKGIINLPLPICEQSLNNPSKESITTKKGRTKKSKTKGLKVLLPVEDLCKTNCKNESPILINGKDNNTDSDDSMKSDIPLKKYAEEMAKFANEISTTSTDAYNEGNNDIIKEINIEDKNKKPSKTYNDENIDNSHTEDEIRSEQFMESFGFFSERKPRKSNLLATKKISETFHNIANESEDIFYESKDKSTKKAHTNDNNKNINQSDIKDCKDKKISKCIVSKKPRKKGRRKRRTKCKYANCPLCKREYLRRDNAMRHKISLVHASNVSELEMKFETVPYQEPLNYLVHYKFHVQKIIQQREKKILEKKERGSTSPLPPFVFPSMQEIISAVEARKAQSQNCDSQNVARRGLSRDEELFLDCCELLKESHKPDNANTDMVQAGPSQAGIAQFENVHPGTSQPDIPCAGTSQEGNALANALHGETFSAEVSNADTSRVTTPQADVSSIEIEQTGQELKEPCQGNSYVSSTLLNDDEKSWDKNEGEVDFITAKNILESEEVRNLEKDLISGLKEAVSKATSSLIINNINSPETLKNDIVHKNVEIAHCSKDTEFIYSNMDDIQENVDLKPSQTSDSKATIEAKTITKLDTFDIFEDKFDIIKRKSRSQAAAAKNVERSFGMQQKSSLGRKKPEKKTKSKKKSKKNIANIILTKGALKEFDGIKVSIPTSDINISALIPMLPDAHSSLKKKKKSVSKKKKELSISPTINYSIPDNTKDTSSTVKQSIDVYEFMDNEDTDMFDFRTKRLDRFKSASKEIGHSSKADPVVHNDDEESQHSNNSASDVDDFVYMSDEYSCSADETENSVLSANCESPSESKRSGSTANKKKESTEKNAVMGKIFKHNAMRTDKKIYTKAKESECDKANLDELFDSLLENEPDRGAGSEGKGDVREREEEAAEEPPAGLDEEEGEGEVAEGEGEGEEETGVARQRARRKCTVGKQNVLAESWSTESEGEEGEEGRRAGRRRGPAPSRRARRPAAHAHAHWRCPEPEEALVEQHGWIVGDSHKKLVTMLAHAKGRRRDDAHAATNID